LKKIRLVLETDRPFPKLPTIDHLSRQGIRRAFSKMEMLSNPDLLARPCQALPGGRAVGYPFRQQYFHLAMQEVAHGRVVRAQRLGMESRPGTEKPRGYNAGVVQHQQVAGSEQA